MFLGITYALLAYKNHVIENQKIYQYNYTRKDREIKTSANNEEWLDSLSQKKDFSYPVAEADFEVNFLSSPTPSHRFVIEGLDSYVFFCLREILEEKKIHFATNQSAKNLDVILYLPEQEDQKILKILNYYGIQYKKN
ncbi:hypothetical protein [Helicobacter mustelae]|uniref:Putative periplasmic protein n=1 Tax=Helicobacter mustelae (strain ATCC 43772 / CCUG 25715 / CIP 103759 / LMG 18044 / NCTC 12198 / R85-136P) TaxID=679897 RepID=D3UFT7_HELM1|nr:hypothetical protein [Helicobacter mustelae]CBG39358.1 Putative periplasmic protein [Helicobacter mustelae 12198]